MKGRRSVAHAMGAAILLLAPMASAQPPGAPSKRGASSGQITGNTVVKSVRGAHLYSYVLSCQTAPCFMDIYDSSSASGGTAVWETRVATNNSSVAHDFGGSTLVTNSGIRVELDGGGASAFVLYE